MERRIATEILTFMDNLSLKETNGKPVMIIGATNQVNTLDSALERNGRFTYKVLLNAPRDAHNMAMGRLYKISENPQASTDHFISTVHIATQFDHLDNGLVVSPPLSRPLAEPVASGQSVPLSSIQQFLKANPKPLTGKKLDKLYITYEDFLSACNKSWCCARREGFSIIPNIT